MSALKLLIGSSVIGLGASLALLIVVLYDEKTRRDTDTDGVLKVFSIASIVLKSQLVVYFTMSLLSAVSDSRHWRTVFALASNLIITSTVIYRLKVRHDMINAISYSNNPDELARAAAKIKDEGLV